MEQKIAIVTGGGSGLGYATAKKFTSNNIFTFVIGRDQEKLNFACNEFGKNCAPVVFDISNLNQIPELINKLMLEKGHIDILVNNAGINMKKPMLEVTDDDFSKVVQTNLLSVFSLSREVAKVMVANKSGSIINISSMTAHYGLPYVIAYSASKTAIEGMTRAMAAELSPHGVRVNCIAPGFIVTNMTDRAFESDPERKRKVLSRTPMGKMGQPEDVANAAYFLSNDESSFMTGTVIPVDGGNSVGF